MRPSPAQRVLPRVRVCVAPMPDHPPPFRQTTLPPSETPTETTAVPNEEYEDFFVGSPSSSPSSHHTSYVYSPCLPASSFLTNSLLCATTRLTNRTPPRPLVTPPPAGNKVKHSLQVTNHPRARSLSSHSLPGRVSTIQYFDFALVPHLIWLGRPPSMPHTSKSQYTVLINSTRHSSGFRPVPSLSASFYLSCFSSPRPFSHDRRCPGEEERCAPSPPLARIQFIRNIISPREDADRPRWTERLRERED